MRKVVMLAAVIGVFSLTASAQEIYSEGGFGIGKGLTFLNGKTLRSALLSDSYRTDDAYDFGVDVGVKVGYGPFGGSPLYFALEISGMAHAFVDDDAYSYQYQSFLIGPGFLYYPMPRFQIAGSIGYSFTSDYTNAPDYRENPSGSGIAYNVSAGVEIGSETHGILIGVKFFNAHNFFTSSKVATGLGSKDNSIYENSMLVGIFFRYTYWRRAL